MGIPARGNVRRARFWIFRKRRLHLRTAGAEFPELGADAARKPCDAVCMLSLYQLSIEPGTPWASLDSAALSDGYAAYRFAQWYLPQKRVRTVRDGQFRAPRKSRAKP